MRSTKLTTLALVLFSLASWVLGKSKEASEYHNAIKSSENKETMTLDITMPWVHPDVEDDYLCTAHEVGDAEQYIVKYEALTDASRAHHMLIYGCQTPASDNEFWNCGAKCRGGSPKILWAWAKNAQPTVLPEDVGFQVGAAAGVKTLVVQIHYNVVISATERGDTSGVRLTLTPHRQRYIAGILIMLRGSLHIPAGAHKVHGNVSCKYQGPTTLYPFAFRVHAHSLARVISAYHNNGSWYKIGKGNPQWPQAFYPIPMNQSIKPGEIMAAQCTYDASLSTVNTEIGGGHMDEMCNFYMMYYTDANQGRSYFSCMNDRFPEMIKTLPGDSDVPLPPNPDMEMEAKHSHIMEQGVAVESEWTSVDDVTLGQVSGVAVDSKGHVHIFHRGTRVWDQRSFDKNNNIQQNSAITEDTLLEIGADGKLVKKWGTNMFYMPHGLHIDHKDNIWVTDVGLHQVMRFKPGTTTPDLTLGTKLEPGSDNSHFCKPTDVAVLQSGEFFISDGYCNSRILKYSASGKLLSQWGKPSLSVEDGGFPPGGTFVIPHSITAVEDRGWVCVADRENGRIQCFNTEGKFIKQMHPAEFHGRLFAVTYSPTDGLLYAVNGPDEAKKAPVKGFILAPETGELIETFGPSKGVTIGEFENPHDIAVSPKGDFLYVVEIVPNRLWKLKVQKDKIAEKHKSVKKMGSRPSSVDSKDDDRAEDKLEENFGDMEGDFSASIVIGLLLIIPIIIIVMVTVFMRLKRNARLKGYKKAAHMLPPGEEENEEDESWFE